MMKQFARVLCLTLSLLHPTIAAQKRTVLSQLGPYPVTITDHEVLTNRTDPLASTPQKRRLMITVYRPHLSIFSCPLSDQVFFPYAPPAVAQGLNDLLSGPPVGGGIDTADYEQLQLINCTTHFAANTTLAPLVLFSHGLQSSRYVHASTLQAVASSGYTVVAVDHTYDAVAVVFPDGDVVKSNLSDAQVNSPNMTVEEEYIGDFVQPVRVADLISVLDAIEMRQLIPDIPLVPAHKPAKAAVYGHSVGGSTSAGALVADPRFAGGMNIDGSFVGYVQNLTNITQPFYMMGEETAEYIIGWPEFYGQLKGWKTFTEFNGTIHLGFTDLPLIVDLLNKRTGPQANKTMLVTGAIGSERNLLLQWRYTVAWLDFVLRGKREGILERGSFAYPDVRVVGHEE